MTWERFGDTELADAFDAADRPGPRSTSGTVWLVDMAAVLRAAGLTVTEQSGWMTRARSSGGYAPGKPWCIMWHHAASAPNSSAEAVADYASYGSDVAPVCNLVLGRDGAVIVCAAGATNTNGTGGPFTVSRGVIPVDQMNTHAIGIEAVNTGVGESWPQVQIDAYFAINNALAAAYGLDPGDCCTHAAWTPGRKIDPATAAAVQGPWRPASINSSGTWALEDVQHEARRRATTMPPPAEEDHMYLAHLQDGTVCVVGSAVRPVSGDEIAAGGPFAKLPHYYPDPSSYWHMWLAAGVAEYGSRVQV
jgi:N-acetylmuramoyl-L-alanine amidase